MEVLEDKIKEFLATNTVISRVGYGFASGEGTALSGCSGYGKGESVGEGDSLPHGDGYDIPDGAGSGLSLGEGDAFGAGFGYNIEFVLSSYVVYDTKAINGYEVHRIDNIPTILTSIRGNVAQGFVVQSDFQLKPCYVVKENNEFAHGETLRDAFDSLQEKLYNGSTSEERIEAFKKKFPEYDVKYDNKDLFTYHHVLTGSCRMGRETFVVSHGLSLDGKTSVREFVELTQNAYGGDIIKKLPGAYGVEQLTTLSCEREKKKKSIEYD